ncbi:MAG: type II toxin-antitoxin system RelE/ParE family toxin [Deferribacterales bacterium]
MSYRISICQNEDGKEPFNEWLSTLEKSIKLRILRRLDRIAMGNFGDHKQIDGNVYELRFFFGSGYRIYFGKDGETLVVLLCGGDKSSQNKDIETARSLWRHYNDKIKNS